MVVVAESSAYRVRRHRWVGFINGFSSGIGLGIFLLAISVWLVFNNSPAVANLIGFIIVAIITGLTIFLLSITVEIFHQAKLSPPESLTAMAPSGIKLCSKCGKEMRFITQIGKYYCSDCKSYE